MLVFTLSPTHEETVTAVEIGTFMVRYRLFLKKSMNVVYKTNIDCIFILGMVENYCTLGKIQPWPTIHFGPVGLGE